MTPGAPETSARPGPADDRPATRASGRIVVLVSGTGSNLAALLAAHDDPAFGGRVVGVVSDRPGIRALDIARDAGVPTAVVSLKDFPDRAAWDVAMAEAMAVFSPDLVVHAGFMKILGAPSLQRFGGRMVNTHPALLPSFPGAHGVRDALAYGVKVTGCSVIVIDAGVDSGPILAQEAVPVLPGDDEATLHERIKVVERRLLVDCVGRIVREGLHVEGRTAVIGPPA
ncbi:phosphoribosylglycinamide formyltransferase [Cellulomonas fimi]|uniref:Phosphoribosylglycinamide formyltransferase n=1 Tax=Cellulomonas fimi (strain ATCC 484 / DSM 20113 / JCM 1341 / CCUG 24087 / LMG 16345 / NBRC 15513 / NCIMB 8980 / NCTC 7547 / NRS-133) TaxID=590998 RepID=F4H2M6_CELFA|nr:phosphoribosylglycinamide formyltransferase [Cellulomonas fimi]AEE45252.1 phosphoribosylglycinamide formyltransferase [Cellulomonas fimi ATCC 484]NNH07082.1 phosphoribosylglycinamide formyltransferase [Cellulomonas fimi]VEH28712.1 Phosphoribosylglycinamide formyltransferase [Cellulomonas fimi]